MTDRSLPRPRATVGVLTLVLLPVILILSLGTTPPAQAGEVAAPATAAEATADLFLAWAANDIDRAVALTAPVKDVPPEAVREYYQRMVELTKKNGVPQVIAHLVLGDTAVVVVNDNGPGKAFDLDPAYLVRRDGKWLVLFKLTRFDRPYFKFDDARLNNFKMLRAWYEEQEPRIRSLLGSP
jgi:hypothetical protein